MCQAVNSQRRSLDLEELTTNFISSVRATHKSWVLTQLELHAQLIILKVRIASCGFGTETPFAPSCYLRWCWSQKHGG